MGNKTKNKWKTNGKQTENLPITKRIEERKNIKNIYGEYHNVKLTDAELEKLKSEFPDWQERIERLSEYIDSKGDKYKNHLSTIRMWARRDKEKAPIQKNEVQKGLEQALALLGEQDG